jgi:Ser/Thr protein kinase RdoA (MazF antagonist)
MIQFRKRGKALQPQLELAAEIAETLFQFGGAAHRDRVIEVLIAMRRDRGQPVGEGLALEIVSAFDAFCDFTAQPDAGTPMFTLPFGAHSHRWALRDASARCGVSAPIVALPPRDRAFG